MIVGIVSDSHGKAKRLRSALATLIEHGAEAVVHCGDVGSADCIAVLGEADLPVYVVAGNMDRRPDKLAAEAGRTGVHFEADVVFVPLSDARHLAATHGNDPAVLARLIDEDGVCYVCHGHTHRRRDDRIGDTRVINPGALRHANPSSVALLDTDTDTLEYFELG